MTDEMIALARRAVACKGWRWMAGMLTHDGYRMLWCSETEREWAGPHLTEAGMAWRYARIHGEPHLPDLTDPATLGCLLALVRKAYSEDRTWVRWWEPEGCAYSAHPLDDWKNPDALFTSEAEALVAALEAAP